MSRSKRNAAAEEYLRRAPNFALGAAADVSRIADEIRGDSPNESQLFSHMASLFLTSHKFALPDNLVDLALERPAKPGGFRLPFPTTVFEASLGPARAVIAMEETSDFVRAFGATGGAGREWIPSDIAFYFPLAEAEETRLLTAEAFARGASPQPIEIDSLGRLRWPGGDFWVDRLAIWTGVGITACRAMECVNVSTEVLRPNREARAARPGSTLFDYHVLMIDPSKERNPSEDHGGTHASPRTHLRRGHIRRLPWGPRVWVNSCVVNPTALGTVNKDYAIKSSAPGGSPERK